MTRTILSSTSRSTRHFVRHFGEMVVAMVLGMVVLGLAEDALLGAAGVSMSALHDDAPALMLLLMAVNMTVPMVAWMRHRGHGWPASLEMAAAMFLPTFAIMALPVAGVEDIGLLMVLLHVVMLPSMLVAMLLRREEYSHHAPVALETI